MYIFDKFFGNPVVPIDKYEYSNVTGPGFTEEFSYSKEQPWLEDFANWLEEFMRTDYFQQISKHFIDLNKRILNESDPAKRRFLLQEINYLGDRK